MLDIRWWTTKGCQNIKPISRGNPDFTTTTDASLEGWGACRDSMEPSSGRWLAKEIAECEHVNCLELKAAKLGLLFLCEKEEHVLIHFQSDVTTVTFINNMGGTHSKSCNKAARDIWLWCTEKTWLKVTHIPGIQNETADRLRPNFQNRTEWQPQPSVFKLTTKKRGKTQDRFIWLTA